MGWGTGGREKRGREAGYLKGAGARRNGKNFATLAQYFAIGKVHGGGSCYGSGWELGVQGVGGGMFRPSRPPPAPPTILDKIELNYGLYSSMLCSVLQSVNISTKYLLSLKGHCHSYFECF